MGSSVASLKIDDCTHYEGQVINNIPNGKGTLRISSDHGKNIIWNICGQFNNGDLLQCNATHQNILYEGTVRAGTLSGAAKVYHIKNKIKYQGNFQNGILISGTIVQQNNYRAKCSFIQQQQYNQENNKENLQNKQKILKLNGLGQYEWFQNKQKVSGKFQNGQLNGKGIYNFTNGDTYTGNFIDGFMEGFGHYYSNNSLSIKQIYGYFQQSKAHSKNKNNQLHKIQFRNGDIYEGQTKNNKIHARIANYKFKDGTLYQGSIYKNQFTGNCEISYRRESSIYKYKGQILKGSYNGLGIIQFKNGVILKGFFLNNKKNGPAIIIYGSAIWKCLYVMDQLIGSIQPVQKNCLK